jgi:hypothetical protein
LKTSLRKQLNWFVVNLAYGLSVWFATIGGIGWLQPFVVGFTWLMLLSYLAVLTKKRPENDPYDYVPKVLFRLLDFIEFAMFIYSGWYVTAVALIAGGFCLGEVNRRYRKARQAPI